MALRRLAIDFVRSAASSFWAVSIAAASFAPSACFSVACRACIAARAALAESMAASNVAGSPSRSSGTCLPSSARSDFDSAPKSLLTLATSMASRLASRSSGPRFALSLSGMAAARFSSSRAVRYFIPSQSLSMRSGVSGASDSFSSRSSNSSYFFSSSQHSSEELIAFALRLGTIPSPSSARMSANAASASFRLPRAT